MRNTFGMSCRAAGVTMASDEDDKTPLPEDPTDIFIRLGSIHRSWTTISPLKKRHVRRRSWFRTSQRETLTRRDPHSPQPRPRPTRR